MARAVAISQILVDADMKRFRKSLGAARGVATKEGGAAGNAFTRAFNKGFNKRRYQGIGAMAASVGALVSRAFVGAAQKIQTSWSRMDSTVRLVLTLIAIAAGQAAVVFSALGSTVVSMASSVGMSLGIIFPLIGVLGALILTIGLAVSAWEEMNEIFPEIATNIDRVSAAWENQASSFAQVAGAGIAKFFASVAQVLNDFDFGTPLGKATNTISNAFANMLQSGGMQAFFQTLTEEYPAALAAFGVGFASVFSALGSVLAGAAPLAQSLGESFRDWAEGLAEAAERARESGAMGEVFQRVGESVSAVLGFIRGFSNALGALMMATSGHGNTLWETFTRLIGTFTAWVQSAEGQNRINEWIATGVALLPALSDLLSGAGTALSKLVTPATIKLTQDFLTNIGEWLPKLADVLNAVSQLDILGNLAILLNTVSDAFAPLIPVMTTTAALLGGAIATGIRNATPLFEGIASVVKPLMENFQQLAQAVIPPLLDGIARISGVIQPVLAVLGQLITFVGGLLVPILSDLLVGAINGVVMVFTGLADVFMGVVEVFRGLGTAIMAFVTGDMAGVTAGLSQAWEGIKQIFMGALTAVVGFIQVWLVGRALALLRSVGAGLLNVLRAPIMAMVNFFRQGLSGMATTVYGWGLNVLNFFRNAWTNIRAAFSGGISQARTVVSVGLANIRSVVTSIMNRVRSVFSTVWNAIRSVVTSVVNAVRSRISSTMSSIRSTVSSILNGVRSTFSSVWNAIRSAVTAAINAVRSVIQSGMNTARSVVSSVLNAMRSVFSSVWNAIRSVVTSALNTVRSIISSVMSSARSRVSSAMTAIQTAFRSGFSRVMSIVRELPGRIVGALRALAGRLRTVGTQAIQGLIGGIRAMAGRAADAAKKVVGAAIDGAKRLLGIKSPSRVFRTIGNQTGEGFALGMDAKADAAFKSAKGLAESAINGVDMSGYMNAGIQAAEAFANGIDSGDMGTLGANYSQMRRGLGLRPTIDPVAATPRPQDPANQGGGTSIESGAISVITPAEDPEIVAQQLLDRLTAEL